MAANRAMVAAVRLDLAALGAVSDLTLDRAHEDGQAFGADEALQGRLRVGRGLDGVQLTTGQPEAARNLAGWGHHNLIVGPEMDQFMI